MNGINIKCTVLCLLVVASSFGAGTSGYTARNQRDTLAMLAKRICLVQQQANNGRYGTGDEAVRLGFASDNFGVAENGRFRYRAVFSKRSGKPAVIDKYIAFTGITSIYPLPISADGVGALRICYGTGDTVSFFYRNSGITNGKLLGFVLDLVYHVNKANGINLDKLLSDWETHVVREQTYGSISQFIAKHPDSFLTEFARMVRNSRQQPTD